MLKLTAKNLGSHRKQKETANSCACSVFKDTDSLSAKVRSQLLLVPDRTSAQSKESERQREPEEQRQRREGNDPLYSPTRYAWDDHSHTQISFVFTHECWTWRRRPALLNQNEERERDYDHCSFDVKIFKWDLVDLSFILHHHPIPF